MFGYDEYKHVNRCYICGNDFSDDEGEMMGFAAHEDKFVCHNCRDNGAEVCEGCGDVDTQDHMTHCACKRGGEYWLCAECMGKCGVAEVEVLED